MPSQAEWDDAERCLFKLHHYEQVYVHASNTYAIGFVEVPGAGCRQLRYARIRQGTMYWIRCRKAPPSLQDTLVEGYHKLVQHILDDLPNVIKEVRAATAALQAIIDD